MPGVVDAHCHWDWPDWPLEEGIRCTSNAVTGGVTTNMHMMIEPGSLVEGIQCRKAKWEELAFADATIHAVVFSLKHVEEIPEVARIGIPSFKFFMPYRGSEAVPPLEPTDDGNRLERPGGDCRAWRKGHRAGSLREHRAHLRHQG